MLWILEGSSHFLGVFLLNPGQHVKKNLLQVFWQVSDIKGAIFYSFSDLHFFFYPCYTIEQRFQ